MVDTYNFGSVYMLYLHIRRQFNDVIFLFLCKDNMGDMLMFNYLPPKIKFGAFRLKLAH